MRRLVETADSGGDIDKENSVANPQHTHPPAQLIDKTVLVTGANRGLGRALVDEALRRGAKRVHAASRQPMVVPDKRVTSLRLDVTDPAQIQEAVDRVESLDILINNAGVSVPDDLSDRSAFEQHLAVNLYGTLDVTQAFLPSLTPAREPWSTSCRSARSPRCRCFRPIRSRRQPRCRSPSRCARCWLAGGVSVYAVMPGPIDTDMVRALEIPKTPPEDVARATLDGVERGEKEIIFPDPMSAVAGRRLARGRGKGARAPERRGDPSLAERRITGTLWSASTVTAVLRTIAQCWPGPAHDPNAVVGRTAVSEDAAASPRAQWVADSRGCEARNQVGVVGLFGG
jgi:NAD(P)-dependent dehydrogenase (short-subunit alcohol dehydrogenase family)